MSAETPFRDPACQRPFTVANRDVDVCSRCRASSAPPLTASIDVPCESARTTARNYAGSNEALLGGCPDSLRIAQKTVRDSGQILMWELALDGSAWL